jgi:tRNA uridine 5-carboxymethylaminomethyl modification enzyme
LLEALEMTPNALFSRGIPVNLDGQWRSAATILGYPAMNWARLAELWPALKAVPAEIGGILEIEAHYVHYLDRQAADIEAYRRDEALLLPTDLDYGAVPSLSIEVREKLAEARPRTLGAAGRLSGVTPAAIIALLGHVRRAVPSASREAAG